MSIGSVSERIEALKRGNENAMSALWNRFSSAVKCLVRRRLAGSERTVADEEDVALSAFHCFCKGAKEGRFAELAHRDELWKLLLTIASQKVIDHKRFYSAKRRASRTAALTNLDQIASYLDNPEMIAALQDESRHMIDILSPALRSVAKLRLEGRSNDEISACVGISRRSVTRKVQLICTLWKSHLQADEAPK